MDSSIKHLPCRLETAVRSFSQQTQIISPFLSRYCVGEWFFFCTTAWNCLCCGKKKNVKEFQGQLMQSERKLLFIAYTKICTSTYQIKVSKKGKQITQELCKWCKFLLTFYFTYFKNVLQFKCTCCNSFYFNTGHEWTSVTQDLYCNFTCSVMTGNSKPLWAHIWAIKHNTKISVSDWLGCV